MAKKAYLAEQEWLSELIRFSRSAEVTMEAQRSLKRSNVGLPEAFDILENGDVIWADRDHEYCEFIVIGRNCDDEEIEVHGRFQSSTLFVAIDKVAKH